MIDAKSAESDQLIWGFGENHSQLAWSSESLGMACHLFHFSQSNEHTMSRGTIERLLTRLRIKGGTARR